MIVALKFGANFPIDARYASITPPSHGNPDGWSAVTRDPMTRRTITFHKPVGRLCGGVLTDDERRQDSGAPPTPPRHDVCLALGRARHPDIRTAAKKKTNKKHDMRRGRDLVSSSRLVAETSVRRMRCAKHASRVDSSTVLPENCCRRRWR